MADEIKAISTDIRVGRERIDAYKLQTHEFERRLGVTGISTTLGYSKEWLGRLHKGASKQLISMQQEGYTGCIKEVQVTEKGRRGSSIAKTISIRDFNKLLAYESIVKKNVKAIILLVAFSEAGIERVVQDAFDGVSLDWFAEKIVHYSQWTFDDLQEALAANYEDIADLYPWSHPDSSADELLGAE